MLESHHSGLLHGNGCNLHPNCFTCPYPDCVVSYDGTKLNPTLERQAVVLAGVKQGMSLAGIASIVGENAYKTGRIMEGLKRRGLL